VADSSVIVDLRPSRRANISYILGGLSIALTAALCILVAVYWSEFVQFAKYGYIGALIISFLAGATVLVPVPSVFIVFSLGAVLNPLYVGIIAGVGEAVGSMVIYVTGYSGNRAMHALDQGVMLRFRDWIRTKGAVSVFAMSAIFNPLFFPFTAIAGMMHYGWWRFLLLCLAGKTVKNIMVATLGYFGVKIIFDMLGGRFPW